MPAGNVLSHKLSQSGSDITFVDAASDGQLGRRESIEVWRSHMAACEAAYMELLKLGCAAEDARCVLPSSAACVLAMTANLREWKHVLRVRTDGHAQHNVRRLMGDVRARFAALLPEIYAAEN